MPIKPWIQRHSWKGVTKVAVGDRYINLCDPPAGSTEEECSFWEWRYDKKEKLYYTANKSQRAAGWRPIAEKDVPDFIKLRFRLET